MHWPQITMIALIASGLTISLVKHGEERSEYNFWISLAGAAISCVLLYFGGFFG